MSLSERSHTHARSHTHNSPPSRNATATASRVGSPNALARAAAASSTPAEGRACRSASARGRSSQAPATRRTEGPPRGSPDDRVRRKPGARPRRARSRTIVSLCRRAPVRGNAGDPLPATMFVAGVAWAVSGDPERALPVVVVATPCPLILAAPIALVSGLSRAARRCDRKEPGRDRTARGGENGVVRQDGGVDGRDTRCSRDRDARGLLGERGVCGWRPKF